MRSFFVAAAALAVGCGFDPVGTATDADVTTDAPPDASAIDAPAIDAPAIDAAIDAPACTPRQLLVGGQPVQGQGWIVVQQGSAQLTYVGDYTRLEKLGFRLVPGLQRIYRTAIYWGRESYVPGFTLNSKLAWPAKQLALKNIERYLAQRFGKADPAVLKAFAELPREYYHYQYAEKRSIAGDTCPRA